MNFELASGRAVLARTPVVLDSWLRGLPAEWIADNEGPDTWSPYDVLGHLIHGERTDWISRLEILLEHGPTRAFDPFDRFAQFRESEGKSIDQLLDQFTALRAANLRALDATSISTDLLSSPGLHPSLGPVTLRNLLATWVAHDLGHIAQIARVMSKRYAEDVGPWREYLPVLTR